jgi:hypothetical protein
MMCLLYDLAAGEVVQALKAMAISGNGALAEFGEDIGIKQKATHNSIGRP